MSPTLGQGNRAIWKISDKRKAELNHRCIDIQVLDNISSAELKFTIVFKNIDA